MEEASARTAAAVAARRGFAVEADPAAVTGDVADLAARVGRWVRLHARRGPRLLAIGGENISILEGVVLPWGEPSGYLRRVILPTLSKELKSS